MASISNTRHWGWERGYKGWNAREDEYNHYD